MLAAFNASKASFAFSSYTKGTSFLVSLVMGRAIFEKSLIKTWLKFTNPRKDCMSLTFLGFSYVFMSCILSSLIRMPFFPTIYPRKGSSCLWNSHFSGFRRRLYLARHSNT
jgi:hypothetical protein